MSKLYDIPRGSKILLNIKNTETGEESEQICTFSNLDGMYSNISTPEGYAVHLAAYAEVDKVDDYYVLTKETK